MSVGVASRKGGASLFVALLTSMVLAQAAGAADIRLPQGTFGSASQPTFAKPLGLAVDQGNGDLYVIEAGQNEVQRITVSATNGSFVLKYTGTPTSSLAYNSSATTVRDALRNVVCGGAACLGVTGGPGDAAGSSPYVVTFNGTLATTDIAELVAENDTLGGGSGAAVTTTTPGVVSGVLRYASNGMPADFTALGTNLIDGRSGPDEVPEKGLAFSDGTRVQVAIDESGGITDGNIYVTPSESHAVDIFAPDGQYVGQFTQYRANEEQLVGLTGFAKGDQFTLENLPPGCSSSSTGPIDVSTGGTRAAVGAALQAACPGTGFVNFASGGTNTNISVRFQGQLASQDFGQLICTKLSGTGSCIVSTTINGLETAAMANPCGVAVDPAGSVYVTRFNAPSTVHKIVPSANPPTVGDNTLNITSGVETTPCIVSAGAGASSGFIFAGRRNGEVSKVDTSTGALAYQVAGGNNTTHTVDPGSGNLFAASGSVATEYDASGIVAAEQVSTLTAPSTIQGLAASEDSGEVYVSRLEGTTLEVYGPAGPIKPEAVEMHAPVTDVTVDSATFAGEFTIPAPGGSGSEASYRFEYFSSGNGWTPLPNATGVEAGNVAGPQIVGLTAMNLDPNTEYLVRLRACIGECVTSPPLEFETLKEGPTVPITFVEDVTQTSATLGAQINPRGEATSYHFEWATEAEFEVSGEYQHRVPAFERGIGAGSKALVVKESISGLISGNRYRYRVVATNPTGTNIGPGQAFETLNECGLINERCFELVNPPDQGPAGEAGGPLASQEALQIQASPKGSRLAFVVAFGLPGGNTGGEATYLADRQDGRWTSKPLSVPPSIPSWAPDGNAEPSFVMYMAEDLSCGFISSRQPLTPDLPAASVEAGIPNLYRINSDDSHTLITNLMPTNPSAMTKLPYTIIGASPECDRVYFRTRFQYPGVDFSGASGVEGLYEWTEPTGLRNPGRVPGPSGEVVAGPAVAGAGNVSQANPLFDWRNAVSHDGSRLIFTAARKAVAGPAGSAELDRNALFSRSNGATIDISASETTTPNQGAFYQYASRDGSKIFFLANYGLTDAASNGSQTDVCSGAGTQCDLYEYDFSKPEGERLSSLTSSTAAGNPQGAVVAGILDGSEDGSQVYFAARGQLVPEEGGTYAENVTGAGSLNVYLYDEGDLSFVAALPAAEINDTAGWILSSPKNTNAIKAWSSRATPSGRHLLFETTGRVTQYDSGGVKEAYLYSSQTGETICVSCRRDGAPSVGTPLSTGPHTQPLASRRGMTMFFTANYHHPSRTISDDGTKVYFTMPDALATGAVDGNTNLYEWDEGQISLLATWKLTGEFGRSAEILGSSADGGSVFLSTAERLSLEDPDDRRSIFVARSGSDPWVGPAPSTPCDALSEGCRKPEISTTAPVVPSSSSFVGSGNPRVAATRSRCGRGNVRRGNRCVAKQALVRRACAKRKGKARQRCIRNQARRLTQVERRQRRAADTSGRAGP